MYVYIYICVNLDLSTFFNVCIYIYIFIFVNIFIFKFMYIYIYVYISLHVHREWFVVYCRPSSDCYWLSEASLVAATQEAPLLAKPFLAHLTCSEIHAVTQLHWEVLGCFLGIYKQF